MTNFQTSADRFRDEPSASAAADFLDAILCAGDDGSIGDDDLLNGIAAVRDWLRQAMPVVDQDRAAPEARHTMFLDSN